MRLSSIGYILGGCLVVGTFASQAIGDVNLTLQTVVNPVMVGDTVQVRLNVAGTPGNQNVGFVQTILIWDSTKLRLTGYNLTGAFAWNNHGFHNDSGGDNLNAPGTGLPSNDGNAVFRARSNSPTSVPPTGIRVATFEFLAIDTGMNSQINVSAMLMNTFTAVLDADVPSGDSVNIQSITNTTVTINCTTDPQCNDLNPCTDDTCMGSQCQHLNDNTNNPNDGLRCNGVEQSCNNGNIIYVPGMGAVDCSSLNSTCSLGVCNEPMGNCTSMAINNGGACNDGMFCNGADTCSAGSCGIHAGDPCPLPLHCSESLDACVTCTMNSHCQDAQFCNSAEVCLGNGTCGQGPDPCPPPNDICQEATDTCVQCLSAADCDDGNFCNGAETCNMGTHTCQIGTAPCSGAMSVCCEGSESCAPDCCVDADCADAHLCSADVCDIGGTCVHFANSAVCQDGTFCNGPERCVETTPGVFGCQPPNTSACPMGDVCCEVNDACNDECCTDLDCQTADGLHCNGQELCINGVCFSDNPVDCSSLTTDCKLGVCDENLNMCVAQNVNQNGFCNDDNTCTYGDRCNNGACVGCMQGQPGCMPQGNVNIFLDPLPGTPVIVGSTIDVKLRVRSSNTTAQVVDAVEAILMWDPTKLMLKPTSGPSPNPQDPCTPGPMCPSMTYDWLSSSFPNDCSLDAINSPCTGPTPANDGSAFYTALAQLSPNPPAMAPSSATAGMHVTTIKFVVLNVPASSTQISLVRCHSPAGHTLTRVVGGSTPGQVVTGTVGPAININIQQCVNNGQCDDGLSCNGSETCVTNSCVAGTPFCNPMGPMPVCIEGNPDTCVVCTTDTHCSDGLFCNGNERCVSNACQPAADTTPCNPPLFCDENQNECVQCFTAADCNDNIPCTDNQCILGDCFFVPQDSMCQDGVFCNGAEVCTAGAGGGCSSPGNPCHNPASCDEVNDTCGNCGAPTAFAIGPRYISVDPPNGTETVALLVTGLASDPQISCLSKYVQTPNAQGNAGLGTTPVFLTPTQWGTVALRSTEIRPNKTYRICTACSSGFSAVAPVTTWRYGDGNNNNVVNLDDILCMLSAFGGFFNQPPSFCTRHSTDLIGAGCVPDFVITLDDILQVLNAFQGAMTVPPAQCPAVCP